MLITITKGRHNHTLTCHRLDGTFTTASIGLDVINHDLAHYVVETTFDIQQGFYGYINSGMSIQELSTKDVIQTLDIEAMLAEILTRALQGLRSGAVKVDDYIVLVKWEVDQHEEINMLTINQDLVSQMLASFMKLCKTWEGLGEGEEMALSFG